MFYGKTYKSCENARRLNTHTHTECVVASTAIVVTRTRHFVALYVQCLSCSDYVALLALRTLFLKASTLWMLWVRLMHFITFHRRTVLLTYLLLTYLLLTYSMEQIPSWEANRFEASQKIPRMLWNLKAHYRIHSAGHLSLSWATLVSPCPHNKLSEVPS